jgi:hypothetical protein
MDSSCPACAVKDDMIALLRDQLAQAQSLHADTLTHLVNLADQTALARLQRPQPRPPDESQRIPARQQSALRSRPDRMSREELESLPSFRAETAAVEARFVKLE